VEETERRANLPGWERQEVGWRGAELSTLERCRFSQRVHTMLPISSCRGDFDPRINTMCACAGLHRTRARHGETQVMMGNSAVGIVPRRRYYYGDT
jgi:hypothetical protein